MNVLVTGACGLLGAHVVQAFLDGHQVTGVDRHEWWGDRPVRLLAGDLSDETFLAETVARSAPDVVVHCAAMVDVDRCEESPAEAYAVNAALTKRLARLLPRRTLLVYISTDSVFKGDSPFASEDEPPCPRTAYARSKLHGEWECEIEAGCHLIVRTNLYGWSSGRKKTFAEWLYEALRSGEPITLFEDVFSTPIYVCDLAAYLVAMVERGCRGRFHVAGGERVSKLEFGLRLAALAGFSNASVTPGAYGSMPRPVPRPRDMSLATDRLRSIFGAPLPGCDEGIRRFLGDHRVQLSGRATTLARTLR